MKNLIFFILLIILMLGCDTFHRDKNSTEQDNKLQGLSSIEVKGPVVDEHTRCIHYHSEEDVIAIKMKCCNEYYPCIKCHNETADHAAAVWPKKNLILKQYFVECVTTK
ncbi:CHY zinc finger protein [Niabella ginsengisoli]|uniref:CHY zinc finger protein n=1 Tax=Niabella ginsengisoli TaxID=522298 RepID=A0ABS9SPJ3_9BACT|nr:CHY zinc finger protein [Niabella ginsengisoli]MCH5600260.1 CHY zinc finger protein [Niabella ginsengisoli]